MAVIEAPATGGDAGRGSPRAPAARLDARDKASGRTRYAGDLELENMLHAALVRSPVPHARITGVELAAALAAPGVAGAYLAADLDAGLFGRRVRDTPLLASGKVRYLGEPVVAVLASSRDEAEAAAALVELDLEELPAVFEAALALTAGAPLVHDDPSSYQGAVVGSGDPANLQSAASFGEPEATERALAEAAFVIDASYRTPAVHQGYLEPQVCLARATPGGTVEVWATDKSPYRAREQLAATFAVDPASIVLHPVPVGGDFGGKGSSTIVPICVALARVSGRPVRLALRYGEDLTATNPRHPATIRVRLGADAEGRLCALDFSSIADGGAYAGCKPIPSANLHGMELVAGSYRIPAAHVQSLIAYTNSVPKGHMRAPGAPQATFAFESALDELARLAGIEPAELRRRNLLAGGEPSWHGEAFAEFRAKEVLEAVLAARSSPAAPAGWLSGYGVACCHHETVPGHTSVRLRELPGGRVAVEVPLPETGTGSHTVARDGIASLLGIAPEQVEVVQVSTAELPYDVGVGASRVTAGLSVALGEAARRFAERAPGEEVLVEIGGGTPEPVTSCCAQLATVAVDPQSGEIEVLEIVTALDVAEVLHPAAHRMQVEGGALMGWGYAVLEDLLLDGGQVWAANLGEARLPTAADAPVLKTVLLAGSSGVGALGVKAVGELSNVPTAAAVANAVACATGARLRQLPITAERLYAALHGGGTEDSRSPTCA